MATRFSRHRSILLAALASCWASLSSPISAAAQAPAPPPTVTSTWAAVAGRVQIGNRVYVTDTAGRTTAGTLTVVTDAALEVSVGDGVRRLPAAEVRRIQSRQTDSPVNGILIGAGAGAIPGIYWLIVDPNECTGPCPEDYAAIAVGALLGGLIDRAVTRRVTVYESGAAGSSPRHLLIGPLVGRRRSGVQLAFRF
jgi:hypothetical protein